MPDWWAHRDALRDMLVEMGRLPPPQRRFELGEMRDGWLVYDNERELIGRVAGRLDRYLIVQKQVRGFYLWFRWYVPATAIGEIHEGAVLLNVSRRWIDGLGWKRPPRKPPARWQHS
jgi:hypothetical protein